MLHLKWLFSSPTKPGSFQVRKNVCSTAMPRQAGRGAAITQGMFKEFKIFKVFYFNELWSLILAMAECCVRPCSYFFTFWSSNQGENGDLKKLVQHFGYKVFGLPTKDANISCMTQNISSWSETSTSFWNEGGTTARRRIANIWKGIQSDILLRISL